MTILHVTSTNQPRGAERFAIDLSDELGSIGLPGVVKALTHSEQDPLPIEGLPGRSRFSLATLISLRKLLRDADVAIGHGSSTLAVLAVLSSSGVETPFIYRGIGQPDYWANTPARRLRVRWALSRAQAVTAISSRSADKLTHTFRISSRRVHVIPRGVRSSKFPVTTPEARRRARALWGIPDEQHVVAFVGALSPEKRVDRAVAIAERLPNCVLLIAGSGSRRAEAEELANQSPATAIFAGHVAEPLSVYAAADVLLITSDTEGVPGVAIEAAFTGLPTVATRVGGMVDVIAHGETGFLVDREDVDGLAQAVELAMSERDSMGAAARERCIRLFDLSVVVRAWAALVRDCASV